MDIKPNERESPVPQKQTLLANILLIGLPLAVVVVPLFLVVLSIGSGALIFMGAFDKQMLSTVPTHPQAMNIRYSAPNSVNWVKYFEVSEDASSVFKFYEEALTKDGWTYEFFPPHCLKANRPFTLYQFDLIDVHKLTVSAFSLCTRLISNWY